MSLVDAAATGERLKVLEALRDRLAREVDECASARDVSSLQKGLRETLLEIEDLRGASAEKPKTALDELMARREGRRTG